MRVIDHLVAAYEADPRSSARVLLTTIFGDALVPRSQEAPVQALAALMTPTGANERLVRTSLQRLATDGLVTAERRGRRSFYRVAPDAAGTFADADARIYAGGRVEWDGEWTVAVIDPDADDRDMLRTELRWLGLGAVSPGVHVSPTVGIATVEAALARHANPLVLLTRGPSAPGVTSGDAALLAAVDPFGDADAALRAHIERFAPVAAVDDAEPADAFVVRSLLIDSWRRIVLRTPDVPAELVPDSWPGHDALEITATIYRSMAETSEAHLDAHLGPAEVDHSTRFAV
ncbi:MAG: PaaX family transcriptional regulator C-terminal domain-containing protein [Actinomycetota bacterium]